MSISNYSQAGLTVKSAIQTLLVDDLTELFTGIGGPAIKIAYEAEDDTNAYDDAAVAKLGGIEAGATADQTGAEIKVAYEAELNTNAYTDTEKSKLSGIEAGATADQTGAEIKTAYESESNTNAYTDAEKSKLAAIEASADVTDATNVNAAGATMNTDTDISGNSWVLDEDDMDTDSATKVPTQQSVKAYVDNLSSSSVVNSIGETAANQSLDISTYGAFEIEPTGDITLTITNLSATSRKRATVSIVNGGEHTLSWSSNVLWENGVAPTFSLLGWGNVTSLVLRSYDTLTSKTSAYFKTDGLAVYVVDAASVVKRYTVGSAWDTGSSLTYLNSFDASAQASDFEAIFFSSDGTKMYLSSATNDALYQYTLSTLWDITSAVYATKTLDVSSEFEDPKWFYISSDGIHLYVVAYSTDAVYQYRMSTAWDLSTASYESKNIYVTEDSIIGGIFFNTEGKKMYTSGGSSGYIYQYTLSTEWDVSTATYDSISMHVGLTGFTCKPDGTVFYPMSLGAIRMYTSEASDAIDVVSLQQYSTDKVLASITHRGVY